MDMAWNVSYGLGRRTPAICDACHNRLCGSSQMKYQYLCQK